MRFQRRLLTVMALAVIPASMAAFGPNCLWFFLVAAIILVRRRRRWPGSGTSGGTAAFASSEELDSAGFHRGLGFHVGRTLPENPPRIAEACREFLTAPDRESERMMNRLVAAFRGKPFGSRMIRIPDHRHISIVGKTGGGKGASLLLPTMMRDRRPMIIFDPKNGENYRITAEYRRRAFGHRIVKLDPYGVCPGPSDHYNPLGFIDFHSILAADHAKALAAALVDRTGNEHDPHFCNMAEAAIHAFCLLVLAFGSETDRALETVADFIADPTVFAGSLVKMRSTPAFGGALRRLGGQLAAPREKELGSILSTVAQKLQFLNSPAVASAVRDSSFDPLELRKGKCDIYICLPPDQVQAGLVRYWMTGLLTRLMQGTPDEENEILVLIDEAALLGANFKPIESAVGIARGFGLRLCFTWQSIGQIQDCFPAEKARTFLANMGTQIYLKPQDYKTAEEISLFIGDTTVLGTTEQNGVQFPESHLGWFAFPKAKERSVSQSVSHNEMARRLLRAEEILQMDERHLIVFTERTRPILAEQVRYYDRDFQLGRERVENRGSTGGLFAAVGLVLMILILLAVGRKPGTNPFVSPRNDTPQWIRRESPKGTNSPVIFQKETNYGQSKPKSGSAGNRILQGS